MVLGQRNSLPEIDKKVQNMWDSLENHKIDIPTIQHRMAKHEYVLRDIE